MNKTYISVLLVLINQTHFTAMSLKSEGLTQLEVTNLRKGKIVAIIKLSLFIPGKNERQKRVNTLINLVAQK